MNSSRDTSPLKCGMYYFIGGVLEHFSTQTYSVVVCNIVIRAMACPFTIVLNVLVMTAVKTKVRLQSLSNVALAYLAATDAMVGILVQPLHISVMITTLQGHTTSDVCRLQNVPRFIDHNLFVSIQVSLGAAFIVLLIFCSVMVYRETRHEMQIAAQQVSPGARKKFLKEKRALKLTTIIVVIVILSYLPIESSRIIKNALKYSLDRYNLCTFFLQCVLSSS